MVRGAFGVRGQRIGMSRAMRIDKKRGVLPLEVKLSDLME